MAEDIDLKRAILQRLLDLDRSGLQFLPKPSSSAGQTPFMRSAREPGDASVAAARFEDAGERPATPLPRPLSSSRPMEPAARGAALGELSRQVSACRLCAELVRSRSQTVFGVGAVAPRVAFFGEAPGADEDRQGEPFVGAAGQLLNKIIAACQLRREDVYILNAVKCRPAGNRTPTEPEIEQCWPFAEQQLEILRPEFIVCLGAIAARSLLKSRSSIARLRQQFHPYRDSRVLVTYHPAYLLREPSAKRAVWEDMQLLIQALAAGPPPAAP